VLAEPELANTCGNVTLVKIRTRSFAGTEILAPLITATPAVPAGLLYVLLMRRVLAGVLAKKYILAYNDATTLPL
jgi:hypothetical protein